MEKTVQLYEGKAKKVYATDRDDLVIVSYKDDATALDGLKKGTITGKGAINNRMSNYLMQLLEKQGVKTHFNRYMFHACKDTQFSLAKLGNDAGMYGAFRLLSE